MKRTRFKEEQIAILREQEAGTLGSKRFARKGTETTPNRRSEQKFPKPPSRTSRSERSINVTVVCAGQWRTRCATPKPTVRFSQLHALRRINRAP